VVNVAKRREMHVVFIAEILGKYAFAFGQTQTAPNIQSTRLQCRQRQKHGSDGCRRKLTAALWK
jgi:hypothetical protein